MTSLDVDIYGMPETTFTPDELESMYGSGLLFGGELAEVSPEMQEGARSTFLFGSRENLDRLGQAGDRVEATFEVINVETGETLLQLTFEGNAFVAGVRMKVTSLLEACITPGCCYFLYVKKKALAA